MAFHSYGPTVLQLGIDWGGEGQAWKKSSADSRPRQLQGKVSSKCRAAPISCGLLRVEDESWPLSVRGISFPADFEGGSGWSYKHHFSLFFSSFLMP